MGRPPPSKHASKAHTKRTAQYKAKGHLAANLEARKKKKALKQKIDIRNMRKARKPSKGKGKQQNLDGEEDDDGSDAGMDELLQGDLMSDGEAEEAEQAEDAEDAAAAEDSADEVGEDDDLASDLSDFDEAATHKMDLNLLKEKDPEFFKFLQENDQELLDFEDTPMAVEDDGDEDGEEGQFQGPIVLTKAQVNAWSKTLLQTNSLKILRKVLLAFRSAAQGDNGDDAEDEDERGAEAYAIQSADVYQSLVNVTMRFTPVVLQHHCPAKKMPNGKFKVQTQNKKYAVVQRYIKNFFTSLAKLLESTPASSDNSQALLSLALAESAKLIPYVVGNRRIAKSYLNVLLQLWSSSTDSLRLLSFLNIRTLMLASDIGMAEQVLKTLYKTLISACRKTNAHNLPSFNLMKNSASELFASLHQGGKEKNLAYTVAFSFIRQIALHLRKSLKGATKDAHQAVYNWQIVHALDFWSLVLSSACDKTNTTNSNLQPLIYPYVQVCIGVLKLQTSARFYPLHFQVSRSLLRLMQRTGTFVPLAPHLLLVLDSAELRRKPKPSSQLKPLDFDYYIRAPQSYLRTKTYADGLVDELVFTLAEFYGTQAKSIGFPELATPGLMLLKRHLKKITTGANGKAGKASKLFGALKSLIEKMEAQRTFVEGKRAKVQFGPGHQDQVNAFLVEEDVDKMPLGAHLRRERKVQEQRRDLLERAAVADAKDDENMVEVDDADSDDGEDEEA